MNMLLIWKNIYYCSKTGTILEINSNPARLDLKDLYIRRAKDYGIKFCINTDAHIIDNLSFAEFGIAQARRGWAEASDVINTYPLDKMLKLIKQITFCIYYDAARNFCRSYNFSTG